MRKNKIFLVFMGLVLSLAVLTQSTLRAAEVKLSFDHFYDHAELTQALRALEKANPQFMKVISLGKSYMGRDIWGVIINNPKTGPAEHKPGYYIDSNIHGNEVQGTEVALYVIWYLLNNYGKTELATRLLDERSFYVIPTMNPDSRDQYINKVADPNSPRTGLIPLDEDRDGVADEDGPEDLDGDGSITMMRKKDPNGNMKSLPEDPRIMVPIQPGEKGQYIILGQEGIDNDGDGSVNEDGPGGYDMNRNYGYNWQPPYVQYGAGNYPFCWPETRATRDFLIAHPNIMGAQNFHNSGGMILRGPGAKNLGEYPKADTRVYDYVAKKGEKIIPGYRYLVVYKDMYSVYGGSIDFIYATLGIFTHSNELDMSPTFVYQVTEDQEEAAERRKREGEELTRFRSYQEMLNQMFYHDYVLLGEQYTDWKPYKHPLYGDIEIGGAKKFASRVPPFFKLAETCHRNAAFCLYHADQLPRLRYNQIKVKKLKGDLYQIDVVIENTRVTPSISTIAKQKKIHRVDKFNVEGKKAKLIAAGSLTDRFRGITSKIKVQKNFIWVDSGISSFGKSNFRLLVRGSGSINLVYDSLKGGYYTKTINLK